ncbi:alpha/beta hydrolase [Roseomonas sp. AR75]|uniref:alpha/beta hydrolase n=1 Tax=Roseomonas sp. AR75 TaxID=2562311 RepID=UPI0010BFD0DC|nr:alpha/beta hydrolase [Roseomonas sp. AR75]
MALLGVALGGLLMLGGAGAALYALQDRLIYFPDPTPPPPPALVGLRGVEARTLRTADGVEILAWDVAARDARAPVVLYLHGNGGSLLHRAMRVQRFQREGWGALFVQWRGYGGNPGTPSEAGLSDDARAGLAALQADGIAPSRIVLWGESLGTGIAVRLAAEQPEAVGAAVLESPYTSLLDLAKRHYPLLPASLLLRDRFDSLSRIAEVRVPILILQGSRDTLVPPAMGRALAARATAPVEVWEAPTAGHNEIGAAGGVEEAARFLGRSLPAP